MKKWGVRIGIAVVFFAAGGAAAAFSGYPKIGKLKAVV